MTLRAYNKFDIFAEHVCDGVHNLFLISTDINIMLVNSPAPVVTNQLKADLTEIAGGNGYSAGGRDISQNTTRSGGTSTVDGNKQVWTAVGGNIGPFRYVVAYNDSSGAPDPVDPLISWWDNGSSITLTPGESFVVRFNNTEPTGCLFTLT